MGFWIFSHSEVDGDLIRIYQTPYFIYLMGTIGFRAGFLP